MSIRLAITDAITSATRERDGLQQRVDDYYAQASHILDQGSYESRSTSDEHEIAEAERHGSAGLQRIAAINMQLQQFEALLRMLDERRDNDVAA